MGSVLVYCDSLQLEGKRYSTLTRAPWQVEGRRCSTVTCVSWRGTNTRLDSGSSARGGEAPLDCVSRQLQELQGREVMPLVK